jgi:uncharacterized protein (DUF2126 family)
MDRALLDEARQQDAVLLRRGVEIWLGAEPTFTDRQSQDPWWLVSAEGGDKLERARALLLALAPRLAGRARLLRVVGRHYPGEAAPRFALAAVFRRDGPPGQAGAAVHSSALDGPPGPLPVLAEGETLLTVTPDPGVIEVNTAPAGDLATFLSDAHAAYAAAEEAGLSAVRYRFNGKVSDSGGGGQVTLGGPTPEASPFFRHPHLLPRLVRYLSNHPALSYAFAGECVGSASQGPRPDEGVRERFEELQVAVDRLEARADHLSPLELWECLGPLLVDASGNSHRAEANVEKLWNPWLAERGKLGLVELRSLRMPATAGRLAATAALFRAVAARLVEASYDEPLADWGGTLHDTLALPSFLLQDLEAVLDDLARAGLGLGPATRALLTEPPEPVAEYRLDDAVLTVTPALEFWPLMGDVASQERSSARLVDASSERLEVCVHTRAPGADPGRVGADGWEVALHRTGGGRRHVAGIRFRAFAPRPGLHAGLPSTDPLVILWERAGRRISLELHGWIPGGGTYPGVPADAAEARRRRNERVRLGEPRRVQLLAPPVTGGVTLDLRRLDARRRPAERARHGGPG